MITIPGCIGRTFDVRLRFCLCLRSAFKNARLSKNVVQWSSLRRERVVEQNVDVFFFRCNRTILNWIDVFHKKRVSQFVEPMG